MRFLKARSKRPVLMLFVFGLLSLNQGFLSPDQGEFFSTAERTETIHPVHFSYDVGFRVNQF
jgi:hypothetical protein